MLGKKLVGGEVRDAVHIAIVPVIVDVLVRPGESAGVKFIDGEYHVDMNSFPIVGIIDPFLDKPVKAGERCYLCLHPNSVTDMTHCWSHPQFKDEIPNVKRKHLLELEQILLKCGYSGGAFRLIQELKNNSYGVDVGDDYVKNSMDSYKKEILSLVSKITNVFFDEVYFSCAC